MAGGLAVSSLSHDPALCSDEVQQQQQQKGALASFFGRGIIPGLGGGGGGSTGAGPPAEVTAVPSVVLGGVVGRATTASIKGASDGGDSAEERKHNPNPNPRTTPAGFDPEALERGARALREINKSPSAKQVG